MEPIMSKWNKNAQTKRNQNRNSCVSNNLTDRAIGWF